MADKLRNCPFCGCAAIIEQSTFGIHAVKCGSVDFDERNYALCGCYGPERLKKSAAIAAWNKRPDPVKAQLIEALRAIRLQLLQSNNDSDYAQEAIEKARAALAAAEAE